MSTHWKLDTSSTNQPDDVSIDGSYGDRGVVGWLADVPEALGTFAETVQEEGDERGRRGLALRAGDRDHATAIDVVQPEVERGRDDDTVRLKIGDVATPARDARTLQHDVTPQQRLVSTVIAHEDVGTAIVGVVDEDERTGDAGESSDAGAAFDAHAEDPYAFVREVSEASGPVHARVLRGRAGHRSHVRVARAAPAREEHRRRPIRQGCSPSSAPRRSRRGRPRARRACGRVRRPPTSEVDLRGPDD